MQFMNSSLYELVKHLSDEDFKYLVEEFRSEYLELLKQKGDYPYEYMNSFERFNEEKLPARKYFSSSIKDRKIGDDGKISDGHISVKDNKYLNDYDPKKPSTFISYLDMNNLYGWTVSEYLPYEGFKWLKNTDKFDTMSINDKSPIGYFLEVDLEYPDELHELHNDFPLAPEKLAASSDMLSKHCKKSADKCEIKVGDVKKLIPSLGNKTNYVVHYRNLQLYLSLEMKLTKIHRVLKFK